MKHSRRKRIKRICVAQINYNSSNIEDHVQRIKGIIDDHKNYDLIVFPELILHGHPSFEKPEGFLYRKMKVIYSSISQNIYAFIRQKGAKVIIGELKRRADKYYNLATYIEGSKIQSYTKCHVHWTENFVPGRRLRVFKSSWGKIGINICFDAAFPEVWRVLYLQGPKVIVNISAVPGQFPIEYMWLRMAGAAINNQVFVIYANRAGKAFSGNSAIFNPRGERIISAGKKEEILRVDIDLEEVERWRREEPIFKNRRPLLYREITKRPVKKR